MFELGKNKTVEHQKIANLAQKFNFDDVLFCGEIFNKVLNENEFKTFKDFEDLKTYLKQNPIKKAHILIKASRGMALERLHEVL